MKKLTITLSIFLLSLKMFSQLSNTNWTADWNTIQRAGFFYSLGTSTSNSPVVNEQYWWGLSSPSAGNLANGTYHNAQIAIQNSTSLPQMYVRTTNHLGAGTWAKVVHSKGDHAIDGKLTVKEVEIKLVTGADFVFKPDYNLMPLSEVESFVKEKQHLPEIPSEKEMIENGVSVNELQIKLLQKIEELTLYVIEQDKKIKRLEEQLDKK